MKLSVLGIAIQDGKILSVTRKDMPSKIGLVGGKVESGETKSMALKREVKEEIGKDISEIGDLIIEEVVGKYMVSSFLIDVSNEDVLTPEDGINIHWLTPKDFVEKSEFPDYNQRVIDILISKKIL